VSSDLSVTPKALWQRANKALRTAFFTVFSFSTFINLLVLALPIYTLQVFDRVLSGRSIETLGALTIILIFLLIAQNLLDGVRATILRRAGHGFELQLSELVMRRAVEEAARGNAHASAGAADLKSVRNGLAAPNASSVFDVPWAPIFLILIFAMHPVLGMFVASALLVLLLLAGLSLYAAQRPRGQENERLIGAGEDALDYIRNADAVRAMGMGGALAKRWARTSAEILGLNASVTAKVAAVLGLTKFFRMAVQGGVMGLGAYLVVVGEITPGTMIASSILMARALAPAEQAVSGWRGWLDSFAAHKRLRTAINAIPDASRDVALPLPTGQISVDDASYTPPGSQRGILHNISMNIEHGSALGIIGPSGVGKSTLAQLLVGAVTTTSGTVLYDGATHDQWDPDRIGSAIGYLPQDVQLLNGTVAQNIARFEQDASSDRIMDAAQRAGVHELIIAMPQGYETHLGKNGLRLSGGQRQRLGLARALYGNPSIVVLDEPSSNLDPTGEQALHEAIADLKQSGKTVIVVSHSPSLLRCLDYLVVLRDGQITAVGPREEIIQRLKDGGNNVRRMPQPSSPSLEQHSGQGR